VCLATKVLDPERDSLTAAEDTAVPKSTKAVESQGNRSATLLHRRDIDNRDALAACLETRQAL